LKAGGPVVQRLDPGVVLGLRGAACEQRCVGAVHQAADNTLKPVLAGLVVEAGKDRQVQTVGLFKHQHPPLGWRGGLRGIALAATDTSLWRPGTASTIGAMKLRRAALHSDAVAAAQ
jgi:hypothetical protein